MCIRDRYYAREGRYQVFPLYRRYNEKALPEVLIADLRDELRAGNETAVSEPLRSALEENLARGEQSILFLNRRGSSRMLLCGECGEVPECPRCSVPMTYHSANGRLMCHYCGHSEPAYDRCPQCGGIMKHIGTGTQKVEEELHALFPGAKVLRMDTDTVGASHGHEKLLRQFEEEKIPILLGTQMVAKGLDFENVTLVGVLCADASLYIDNYRAPERTFSLLSQVVGRAGRGSKQGRAIIQTFTPENEVIRAAAAQDYDAFYESEIRMRRLRRYPPFADLFSFTVTGADESRVIRAAKALRDALGYAVERREELKPLTVLLAPFAPHIAEELWEALGHTTSVCTASYPAYDEKHLAQSVFEYPVSVNGKLRFKKEYATSMTPAQIQADVVTQPEAQKWLEGKAPKKVIVVPGKIINIVI